tara:strand:+ start:393 stop:710 length:318 start_codon:yes stop_codon:yes gene_type:complete
MTIAQQLKVTEFPFTIKNKNDNQIYWESSDGYWVKREYDANHNQIYYEDSDGDWSKSEYDTNGKEIYFETSKGVIKDNRPKIVEVTLEEIAAKLGIKVEQLRIKD